MAIPSAVKVFNWTATLYKGSIKLEPPMLFALTFVILFCSGGLTGVLQGALALNVFLHDTYFIVGHFHYVMFGGTVMALLGGLHYWWPKMFGRMYSERWAQLATFLVFVGFNLTFFTQFIMGSRGMPRRYFTYPEEFTSWHVWSTMGSFVMAAGFFLTAAYLLYSLSKGKIAPANPWGGVTLEWEAASPPIHYNFDETPTVGDPYDFDRITYHPETQSYSSGPVSK